ncbi:MAG TPA: hypothetical protein VEC16_07040 [Alphaproteobacteria bacterium]|nr:hypothetical protein [Alphaproteobacteria bacterium]
MIKNANIAELFGELIVFFNGVEKLALTIKEDIVKKGRDAIIIDREVSSSIKSVVEKKIDEIKKLYKEKINIINSLDIDKKNKEDIVKDINNAILSLELYKTAAQHVLNSEKNIVETSYEHFKEKYNNYIILNRVVIGRLGTYMHRKAA